MSQETDESIRHKERWADVISDYDAVRAGDTRGFKREPQFQRFHSPFTASPSLAPAFSSETEAASTHSLARRRSRSRSPPI
jgi:hypothetical protein